MKSRHDRVRVPIVNDDDECPGSAGPSHQVNRAVLEQRQRGRHGDGIGGQLIADGADRAEAVARSDAREAGNARPKRRDIGGAVHRDGHPFVMDLAEHDADAGVGE